MSPSVVTFYTALRRFHVPAQANGNYPETVARATTKPGVLGLSCTYAVVRQEGFSLPGFSETRSAIGQGTVARPCPVEETLKTTALHVGTRLRTLPARLRIGKWYCETLYTGRAAEGFDTAFTILDGEYYEADFTRTFKKEHAKAL
ncbi:MAG: hypothetical protein NUW13_15740 [candidate division KSB1 bacterium]|nr:hypothetical protein [candidate division KSB1 bacterium]